jgi:hypothetical protein
VGKTRITIYIDDEVLDAFRDRARSEGRGYQTAMNEALRRFIAVAESPQDALLSRLQSAIAGALEGVRVVESPKARSIAKRAPSARKTSKSPSTKAPAKRRPKRQT